MKLIAVDLDGTLLNNQNEASAKTIDTILKASEAGHKVVIITGRGAYAGMHIAKELNFDKYGGLVSSSNGAYVYDLKNDKVLINHNLEKAVADEIIAYGKSLGLFLVLYNGAEILAEDPKAPALDYLSRKNKMSVVINKNLASEYNFDLNKVLFIAESNTISKALPLIKERFEDKVYIERGMTQFLDIMPKGISKGNSLLEIADYFNIDHADTIAFGDEINDLSMIKAAGIGVAMGNAIDEIKKAADVVTLTNDEDGVAAYIIDNILTI